MSESSAFIEFLEVSKHYGACRANDGLNIAVAPNTIHALVGENGAGKSTAMKMLFGLERPTSGQIRVRGQNINYGSPRDALRDGIGMVHQHFMLSPVHTSLDNVMLTCAHEAWGLGRLTRHSLESQLEKLSVATGFSIPWRRPVGELAVGVQQQVEIVKLLHAGVDIMIFDEPTAVLSPQEVDSFLAMLRTLRSQGKTIVLITHKLHEVMAVADRVTVMRAGRTVGMRAVSQTSVQELADLMVGRSVQLEAATPPEALCGEAMLELKGVTVRRASKIVLSDLNFSVRRGEIVGLAGVEGNGQAELLSYLYGPRDVASSAATEVTGELKISGHHAGQWTSQKVRKAQVGIAAADRQAESVILDETLVENNLLGHVEDFTAGVLINRVKALSHTRSLIDAYDIKPGNPHSTIRSLSGGNQQKFVMARELVRSPRLLICAQPTRGVDVGSIERIHGELLRARTAGMAIFLVSSQLDELLQLSDRLLVISEGRIVAEFKRGEFDEKKIGRAMLGGSV